MLTLLPDKWKWKIQKSSCVFFFVCVHRPCVKHKARGPNVAQQIVLRGPQELRKNVSLCCILSSFPYTLDTSLPHCVFCSAIVLSSSSCRRRRVLLFIIGRKRQVCFPLPFCSFYSLLSPCFAWMFWVLNCVFFFFFFWRLLSAAVVLEINILQIRPLFINRRCWKRLASHCDACDRVGKQKRNVI